MIFLVLVAFSILAAGAPAPAARVGRGNGTLRKARQVRRLTSWSGWYR